MRLPPWSWLVLSTTVVVIAFFGATFYSWHRAARIDELAQQIARNADPSIRDLAEARTELHVMDALVSSALLAQPGTHPFAHDAFARSEDRLRRDVDAYLALPFFDTERARWQSVEMALARAEAELGSVAVKLDAGDLAGARSARDARLTNALEQADAALGAQIAFDVDQATRLGREIARTRQTAQRISYGLHGVGLGLALFMLGVAVSASRRYVLVQRAAEAELRREVKRREDIVSIVSHDLRNPLSAVGLAGRTLQRALDVGAPGRRQTDVIVRNVARMDRLIGDLLTVAKLQEGGPLAIEAAAQDAGPIVHDVIDGFAATAADKGVDLRSALEDDLPPAFCDAGRIAQVLSNLVGNALKFTSRGGSVVVTVARGGPDELRFSVRDTGAGIPEEAVPHVFERFWQEETQRTRGTGLGLYIAKGIVEAHHGRIWVTSRVGHGSEFQFTIPAASWPDHAPSGDERVLHS